jgi:phosphoribosyl-AMP cyclohydrolase
LWSSALHFLQHQQKLKTPLTDWLSPSHQTWFWYIDPATSILYYNPKKEEWLAANHLPNQVSRTTRSSTKNRYSKDHLTTVPVPETQTLLPATIQEQPSSTLVMVTHSKTPIPTPTLDNQQITSSVHHYLWSHQFYKRLLGPLAPLIEDGIQIIQSLRDGTLLTCCDGSHSPISKLSSMGWILATQHVTLWRGAGPVDGHPDLTNAYRAELGGFVAILHIVLSLCQYHKSFEGSITIYCDCQSAINRLQHTSYGSIKDYLVADYDLLHEGRTLLHRLKSTTNVVLSWVKGHYSGEKKSIQHILNDEAHNLANEFLHKIKVILTPIKLS